MVFGRGKHADAKLLESAWSGDVENVKKVLYGKADLVGARASRSVCRNHAEFQEGDTALHLSCGRGHAPVVDFQLSLKASVHAANTKGTTPLHAAAIGGHHQIVEMLLEHGANPNVPDGKGRAPLHDAALGGHPEVEQILVDRGAQIDAKDQQGQTALHDAARACSEPLVRLLVQAGADLNEGNTQNRTPMHVAVLSADHSAGSYVNRPGKGQRQATLQIVKLMLSLGADVNALDALGETPLDVLTYFEGDGGTDPLVDLLRANGGQWVRYRHRHADDAPAAGGDETIVGVRTASPALATGESPDRDRGTEAITLESGPVTIGRSAECEVRYRSLTLSRRHARIEQHKDGFVVTDLGSHNGTLIDGQKIARPHVLEPGELIGLGAYEFEFDGEQLMPAHGELSHEELRRERSRS